MLRRDLHLEVNMKVRIDIDERYPVYDIGGVGEEVDIPEDKLNWIKQVFAEFEAVQQYLKQLYQND